MFNWATIYKGAWIVLVVLCCIALTCVFLPRCRQLQCLQEKKAELTKVNRDIEQQTKALKVQQKRFKSDPRFVELVARRSGMVAPNEFIIKTKTNTSNENTGKQRR